MISIVCVYNNPDILEEYLLKSLKNQDGKYELILADNTENKYRSAASALNYGGGKAKGDYIMFVHQDVSLCTKNWLDEAERLVGSIPNLGVAGVAGKSDKGKTEKERELNIVWHGVPPNILKWGRKIERYGKAQTLDELLIIIPREIFKKLKFDETVCDDWHFYAVDYCLSVRGRGFGVYVFPMDVYHRGDNAWRLNQVEFKKARQKLARKYMFRHSRIYTTMGDFNALYWGLCPLVLISLFQRAFFLFKSFAKAILKDESNFSKAFLKFRK